MADNMLLGILQGKVSYSTPTTETGSSHNKWDIYFDTASEQYGVSKSLLKATSVFENPDADPMAESGTGPAGPMQISMGTAEGLGISLEDRYRPEIAIPAGAKLYRQLLDHYNGDEVKAVAAYQMGQPAIDAAGGPTGGDKNISNEKYVKRVLAIREKIRQQEVGKLLSGDGGLSSILSPQTPTEPTEQAAVQPQAPPSEPAPTPAAPSPTPQPAIEPMKAPGFAIEPPSATRMAAPSTEMSWDEKAEAGAKAAAKGVAHTFASVGNWVIGPTLEAWRKDGKSPLEESVKAWELTEQEKSDLQKAGLLGQGVATVGELVGTLPLYIASSAAGGVSAGSAAAKIASVIPKVRPAVAKAIAAIAGDAFGFGALGGAEASGAGESPEEVKKKVLQGALMGAGGRAGIEGATALTRNAAPLVQRAAAGLGGGIGMGAPIAATGGDLKEAGGSALLGAGLGAALHHPTSGRSLKVKPGEEQGTPASEEGNEQGYWGSSEGWRKTQDIIDRIRNESPDFAIEQGYFSGQGRDTDRGYARYIEKYFSKLPEELQEWWMKRPDYMDAESGEIVNVMDEGVRGTHVYNERNIFFERPPRQTESAEVTPVEAPTEAGTPPGISMPAEASASTPPPVRNEVPITDRAGRIEQRLSEISDPQAREDLKAQLLDEHLGQYGVTSFKDANLAMRELETSKTPYSYMRADLRNLGGANEALGGHAPADEAMKAVVGDVFTKEVQAAGGVVFRNTGGDELKVLWPNKTAEEARAAMAPIAAKVDAKVKELGLSEIPHPKHQGMPTGSFNIDYGISDQVRNPKTGKINYGEMDRLADAGSEVMKHEKLRAIAEKNGYTLNRETERYEHGIVHAEKQPQAGTTLPVSDRTRAPESESAYESDLAEPIPAATAEARAAEVGDFFKQQADAESGGRTPPPVDEQVSVNTAEGQRSGQTDRGASDVSPPEDISPTAVNDHSLDSTTDERRMDESDLAGIRADEEKMVADELRRNGVAPTQDFTQEASGILADVRKVVSDLDVPSAEKKALDAYITGSTSKTPSPDTMKAYSDAMWKKRGFMEGWNYEDAPHYGEDVPLPGSRELDDVHRFIQENARESPLKGKKLGPRQPKPTHEVKAGDVQYLKYGESWVKVVGDKRTPVKDARVVASLNKRAVVYQKPPKGMTKNESRFSEETGDLFAGTENADTRTPAQKAVDAERAAMEEKRTSKARENVGEGTPMFDKNEQEAMATKQESMLGDMDIIDEAGVHTKGYTPASSMAKNEDIGLSMEPKGPEDAKAVSKHEIVKLIADLADVPLRTGRYRQKALGIFKVEPRVIRVEEAGNIPVVSHEVGHALERDVLEDLQFDTSRWPKAEKELTKLGRNLYKNRKPAGGYASEGWSEYWKLHLSTDGGAAKEAPTVHDYIENVVFKDNPELAQKIQQIKDRIQAFKEQGARKEAESQVVDKDSKNILQRVTEDLTKENYIEELSPFQVLSKNANALRSKEADRLERRIQKIAAWKQKMLDANPSKAAAIEKRAGKLERKSRDQIAELRDPITTSQDPYLAARALRRTAPTIVRFMADTGMIDFDRNIVGRPLSDATKLVSKYGRKGRQEWYGYLYAKRALEYHRLGLEPGMARDRAQNVVDYWNEKRPEYALAAKIVHDANRAVLRYAQQAGAIPASAVKKMENKWQFYFPFERVMPEEVGLGKGKGGSRIAYRAKGSALPIRDPIQAMLTEWERVISAAHERYVLDRVFDLQDVPGIGRMIEEVPVAKQPRTVSLEAIKKQLEDSGANLDNADMDAMIQTFTPIQFTPNNEPIVARVVNTGGKETLKWYYVDKSLYESLSGMNKIPRLGPIADFFLGKPARAFKIGTTGLRASFSISNPLRDVPAAIIQKQGSHSPKAISQYIYRVMKANALKIAEASIGRKSEMSDLFRRLGGEMAQPFGMDYSYTRRTAKEMFQGKVARTIMHPVDLLRDIIQIPESGTRVAAIESMVRERGWDPKNLTRDQWMELANEGSQVSTDFRAIGKKMREWNAITPFLNPAIQGKRQFLSTWKKNPTAAMLVGLSTLTAPAVINWYRNKDKDWYRNMTDDEKRMYTNVEVGGEILRIPKAYEWATVFQTVPELVLDQVYRKDPEAAVAMAKQIVGGEIPEIVPHTVQIAKEQLQNRVDYTGMPIVPRSDVDKPAEEQFGPYTSRISVALGKTLKWSPDRIDHLIRGAFGGVGQDVLSATRVEKRGKEGEPASLPVVGRFFRWGGQYSMRNKPINDFYDMYTKYSSLLKSDDPVKKEKAKAVMAKLRDYQDAMKLLRKAYNSVDTRESRQKVAIMATRAASQAVSTIKPVADELLEAKR